MVRHLMAVFTLAGTASVALASNPPQYTVEVIGALDPSSPNGVLSLPLGLNNNGRVVGYGSTTDSPTNILNWKIGSINATGALAGSARSYGSRVNIRGRIAGTAMFEDGPGNIVGSHAIRWLGRMPQDLGTLGGNYSVALGIDDADRIVGYSTLPGESHVRAFLWENGTMSPLASPAGASEVYAYDISNTGYIVGTAAGPGAAKPYLWTNGVISPLPIPASSRTGGAAAVNNAGVAVGTYEVNQFTGSFAAVSWQNGQMSELGNLGGSVGYSSASDVNNLGQVVGTTNSANGFTGFLWSDGVMYDLRSLLDVSDGSIQITSAQAINDKGEIAAGALINGRTTAILLHPAVSFIPTPGSLAVLIGAGLIAARRRRV